ncbi:MAG: TonB-dependent receptor SusC [Candidatus Ordinivivax streblomastigis]|uniref:TonB-dependent receptor SusC n=1 Tax=Candidatus Ordinivivax streblomastigis TaxID=2540710 RepID=A0A5M8NZ90_9BACT|nr:MAG: TonB-dependent receptor SusC [Candidatus Ordinivivax streblomastigis]
MKSFFRTVACLFLLTMQLFYTPPVYGQSIDKQINVGFRDQTLHDALSAVAKASGFSVNYTMDQVNPYKHITLAQQSRSVDETLDVILSSTNLAYQLRGKNILIITKNPTEQTSQSSNNQVNDIDDNYMSGVLAEVTVISTGYQNLKKEKMTGATVTISAEELSTRYNPNIVNNLEGRIAGLVNYNGKTTIRGTSSLYANNAPLAVVDGLPFEGGLSELNPYDIESVTVLKDAAATAIYGARASNGIIVVTTKQAKEKGKTTVDISGNITVYQKPDYKNYNYLTPAQQVDVESRYYDYYFNGGVIANPIPTVADYINKGNSITPVQYAYYQLAQGLISPSDLDNQLNQFRQNDFAQQFKDNALKNRILQQYNIAIRNRSDKFQSNLVLNFKTDNSGILYAKDNQFNVSYKGAYDVNKWLSVNFGSNVILDRTESSNSNFATSPFNVSPYLRLLDENGA